MLYAAAPFAVGRPGAPRGAPFEEDRPNAMSTTLIHSGTLVRMDAAGTVSRGDVLVDGERIAAAGDAVPAALAALPGGRADSSVDASGCFVLPGFVHGHLHLCQTLFRGLAEQSDLLHWLRESIWPLEAAHTEASVAASARLGALELLAGGVTCINDMGTVHHTEVTAAELERCGLRAVIGKALMDQGDGAAALADRFHGAAGGRIRVSLAPRFILSCSEALWRDVTALSAERGLVVHTHIAESPAEGREVERAVKHTAARYFATHDVLSERFVGAHGVWLEPDELAAIRRANAALVHCPGSNLKLGSGFARVRAWCDAGIRCGLGSDGAACNNRLDTFAEMSLASGISRALDPRHHLSAREVVELATCRGADALGLGDVAGSIEAGKQADLVLLDATAPDLAPNAEADAYTTIVHAMQGRHVRATLVAGRVLYERGTWATLDPARVAEDARREIAALRQRAGR
jgi:5-methylthioadenosine/S-adenosylhomocysteine deaminase